LRPKTNAIAPVQYFKGTIAPDEYANYPGDVYVWGEYRYKDFTKTEDCRTFCKHYAAKFVLSLPGGYGGAAPDEWKSCKNTEDN
jgi:hypothetical protein